MALRFLCRKQFLFCCWSSLVSGVLVRRMLRVINWRRLRRSGRQCDAERKCQSKCGESTPDGCKAHVVLQIPMHIARRPNEVGEFGRLHPVMRSVSGDRFGYSGIDCKHTSRPCFVRLEKHGGGHREDNRPVRGGQHSICNGTHAATLHAAMVISRRCALVVSRRLMVRRVNHLAVVGRVRVMVRGVGGVLNACRACGCQL